MARVSLLLRSVLVFAASSAPTAAFAFTNQAPSKIAAPELDPGSLASVLVLLVGVALLAHRRVARA